MKLISATALALTVLASGYSVAAAPELHVHKTVTINASADKVWNLVKDFNGLNTWNPAVAKDDIVEGTTARYREAYERIVGEPFDAWLERSGAAT